MRRVAVVAFAAGALVLGQQTIAHAEPVQRPASQLPPSGPFPDAECNEDAAHDIYIGPDKAFWECVCQTMIFGPPDCQWYEVPSEVEARLRRRVKARYHLRVIPRLKVIPL